MRDNWQEAFEKWKQEKKLKQEREEKKLEKEAPGLEIVKSIEEVEKGIEKEAKELGREIREEVQIVEREVEKELNIPVNFKKIGLVLIILVIIGVVGFFIYKNFISSQEFNYFYDIGGIEDLKKPYLTPVARMSGVIPATLNAPDYRNITDGLVYFDVPIPAGSSDVFVQIRFVNYVPAKQKVRLGAKIAETWNYTYEDVYISENRTMAWMIGKANFSLKDLYIKDNKLNMLINIPHLGKNESMNYTIPIDWINITVKKNGYFKTKV
jgi:hypothetical protein